MLNLLGGRKKFLSEVSLVMGASLKHEILVALAVDVVLTCPELYVFVKFLHVHGSLYT